MAFSSSAEVYDLLHEPDARWRREGPFLTSWVADGKRILDMGCGTGQHAHRLTQAMPELDLIACDPSPEMLTRARSRDSSARFVAGDLWQPPAGPFDRILVIGNTLALVCDQQRMEAALSALSCVLAPTGRLLVHLIARDGGRLEEARVTVKEGVIAGQAGLAQKTLLPLGAGDYLLTLAAFAEADAQILFQESQRLKAWTAEELHQAGVRAGLRLGQAWGGFDAGLLDIDGPDLLVEFER